MERRGRRVGAAEKPRRLFSWLPPTRNPIISYSENLSQSYSPKTAGEVHRLPRLPELGFETRDHHSSVLDNLIVASLGNANPASTSIALMMPTGTGQAG